MKKRMAIIMWLFGMIGVFSLFPFIYHMHLNRVSSHSVMSLLIIQTIQSGLILALAVWGGVALSTKVNLQSPCFEALANRCSIIDKLRPQLFPGMVSGTGVGIFLIATSFFRPHELMVNLPDFAGVYRVLSEVFYGGITEEILLRWGFMTFILWVLWRFIQRNQNPPSKILVWSAIIASSLLFALGHLPAAHAMVGHLSLNLICYVIIGNTLAGVVFGFLYQRYGLESAMIAHALAHLVKELLTVLI